MVRIWYHKRTWSLQVEKGWSGKSQLSEDEVDWATVAYIFSIVFTV